MERDRLLETSEDRYKRRRAEDLYVGRSLLLSKAWRSLRTTTAYQVYGIFLTKRQIKRLEGKRGKRDQDYYVANNGAIEFTYPEARERYGINAKRFTRALDDLIRVGFIDVSHSGFGLHRDKTLYAVSDRWKAYGTEDFQPAQRAKRREKLGFKRGNRYGCSGRP